MDFFFIGLGGILLKVAVCVEAQILEFMIYNSCLAGKFGAFFASIPLPIFAAIYCVLYGFVGESLV